MFSSRCTWNRDRLRRIRRGFACATLTGLMTLTPTIGSAEANSAAAATNELRASSTAVEHSPPAHARLAQLSPPRFVGPSDTHALAGAAPPLWGASSDQRERSGNTQGIELSTIDIGLMFIICIALIAVQWRRKQRELRKPRLAL